MELVIALALFFGSTSAFAAVDVEELNRELQSSKASWVARESHVSRLSFDEFKNLTGLQQEGLFEDVEFDDPTAQTQGALPSRFDWRDVQGQNWVSPILDQGQCGSCVAFAAIATMETQMKVSSGISSLQVRLSPQALHSCGGGSCTIGWWPGSAAKYLETHGVPDEACMPYQSGVTGKNGQCSAICKDHASRRVRIASFTRPTVLFGNLKKVKRALLEGPVMTAMLIFEDFAAYGGGVYRHKKGRIVSAHAVSIVGWEDATQSFIVRNSWGEDWGERGFFRIAYDDISGAGRMTWAMQMPSNSGDVVVEEPTAPMDVNHPPLLKIDFIGKTDLSKTLKGKVLIDVTTSSTSVPMTSFEFHFRNVATGAEQVRIAPAVLPKMQMGWRTQGISNGTYEIWFVGRLQNDVFDRRVESRRTLVNVRN